MLDRINQHKNIYCSMGIRYFSNINKEIQMPHVITTTLAKDGETSVTRTVTVGEGTESLQDVWAGHTEAVQLELIRRGCDGSIVLKPTEKHPLEEVFAGLPESFDNPELMQREETAYIDGVFGPCLNAISEKTRWARVAIGWAATRLIKMGYYRTLPEVLQAAVEQATKGKGQRHGGDRTPFLEQPWVRLYKTHGLGFLLGQADKKYHEALGKENQEDQTREILGAIVYLGMALLVLEGRVA